MSRGKEYTVIQVGRRNEDGRVDELMAVPDEGSDSALVGRVKLGDVVLGAVRLKIAQWRGQELVARRITGYDEVIDDGLLGGLSLTLKALRPTRITQTTEWEVLDA